VAGPTVAQEEKRKLLLRAAVRVFARKGYHACRVSDIAVEAGVAHGLLYHYFRSKEEVLETIFRDTWALMLEAVRAAEEATPSAREQLRKVIAIVLRSWRDDPDLIRVLVREVTRTPQLAGEVAEVEQAIDALERIVGRGQENGEFGTDVRPRLVASIVYGALDEILTSWVLGQAADDDEAIRNAEQAVLRVVCDGIAAR
jgi:TetR/AcrR family fatty acid metabolism transcriptional regulator